MANAGSQSSSRTAGEPTGQQAENPQPADTQGIAPSVADGPAVGEIVKKIQTQIRDLVADEVALAKSELVPSAKNAGVGAGVMIGALYFVLNAFILLYIAAALAIWAWLPIPVAAGFAIMGGVLVIIAAILGIVGLIAVKKIKGPKRTVAHGKQTAEAVKQAISRGNTAASAPQIEATSQHSAVTSGQETTNQATH
jgi:uncharacterized membrane protein YqjE